MTLHRHLSVIVNFRNRILAVVAGLACLLPAMALGQGGFTGLYYSFPAGFNGPGEMPQVSNANPNFASLAALQASLGPLTPVSVTPTPYLNLNVTGNTNTLSFPTSVSPNTYQYFEGYYSGMMLVSSTGAGTYNFGLGSDDGSMLWVDGQPVINENNYQGFGTYPQQQGSATLNSGYHNVVVGYYQGTGNYALEAGVGGPDTGGTLLDLGTTANSSLQFIPDLVASSAQINAAGAIDPGALGYANLIVGADNLSSTFTGSLSYSNTAMGAVAGILKLGTGQVSVTGNVSYGGATTVAAGTYWVKTAAQLPGYTNAGQVSVNGGILAVGSGDGIATGWNQAQIATMVSNANWNGGALGIDTTTGTFEYDSVIAGPSALTKLGPNALILTAANTYTGNTTISAGTLQLGTGAAGLDGSVAGNVVNNGTLVYNLNGSQTAVGAISGKGGLIKSGPGMLLATSTHMPVRRSSPAACFRSAPVARRFPAPPAWWTIIRLPTMQTMSWAAPTAGFRQPPLVFPPSAAQQPAWATFPCLATGRAISTWARCLPLAPTFSRP
jgi:autotransporter-associated beta strand protein